MTSSTTTRRIKVVHLVTSLEVGGAQHNMLLGLPRLDPERYEHILVSIMNRMQMEPQFRQLGIEVHSLGLSKKTDLAVALRLGALLKKLRPDILHTYLIHGNVLGRIVGRLVGVSTIIGSELTIGQAGTIGKLLTKLTNPLTDAVEVNSETGGKAVVADLGVPKNKIEVILPGLDLDAFSRTDNRSKIRTEIGVSDDQHLILFVGRLRPVKGPEYGIRAFAIAASQNPKLHLALAGEGEQRSFLKNLTKELGIEENITFLGARNDLPDVLSAADIILMPSIAEGFPRVANEAMAASKPIVATRVGGIPEAIIDNVTGLLVESKEIDTMSDAIIRVSSDTELQQRLGNTARQHAELHYSAASYVSRLDDMYSRWANRKTSTTATTTSRSLNK